MLNSGGATTVEIQVSQQRAAHSVKTRLPNSGIKLDGAPSSLSWTIVTTRATPATLHRFLLPSGLVPLSPISLHLPNGIECRRETL